MDVVVFCVYKCTGVSLLSDVTVTHHIVSHNHNQINVAVAHMDNLQSVLITCNVMSRESNLILEYYCHARLTLLAVMGVVLYHTVFEFLVRLSCIRSS